MIEMSEIEPSAEELREKKRALELEESAKPPEKTLPSLATLFCVVGFPIHIKRHERIYSRYRSDYYYDDLDEDDLEDHWNPTRIVIHEQVGVLIGVTLHSGHEEAQQGSVLYTLNLQDGSTVPVAQGDLLTVRGFTDTSGMPRNARLNSQSPPDLNLKLYPSK